MKIKVTQDIIDAADFMRAQYQEDWKANQNLPDLCSRCPVALAFIEKGLDASVRRVHVEIDGKDIRFPLQLKNRIMDYDLSGKMTPFEFTYDARGRIYGVRDI